MLWASGFGLRLLAYTMRSGLSGRRKRPRSLRIQSGLRCCMCSRGSGCFRCFLSGRFFGSFLGSRFFSGLFRGSFFSSFLRSGFLSCFFRSGFFCYSFFRSCFFSGSCFFRSGFFRYSFFRSCFFSGSCFFCYSFLRGGFFGCRFFCSCHGFFSLINEKNQQRETLCECWSRKAIQGAEIESQHLECGKTSTHHR